jgi:hypothetical protein
MTPTPTAQFTTLTPVHSIFAPAAILNRFFVLLYIIKSFDMAMQKRRKAASAV